MPKFVIERCWIHIDSVTIDAPSLSRARQKALALGEPKYVNGAHWLGPDNFTKWEALDEPPGSGSIDDRFQASEKKWP